jgi:hypothetical protein
MRWVRTFRSQIGEIWLVHARTHFAVRIRPKLGSIYLLRMAIPRRILRPPRLAASFILAHHFKNTLIFLVLAPFRSRWSLLNFGTVPFDGCPFLHTFRHRGFRENFAVGTEPDGTLVYDGA